MRAALIAMTLLYGCADSTRAASGDRDDVQTLASDFEVRRLDDDLFIHVSFKELPRWGRFPSNGVIVFGKDGALLIDTPWTPEQTRVLNEWVHDVRRSLVREVVITHAHDDRMGGIGEVKAARIHASKLTSERAASSGTTFTAETLEEEMSLELAGERVEVFFPGAGHAPTTSSCGFPNGACSSAAASSNRHARAISAISPTPTSRAGAPQSIA